MAIFSPSWPLGSAKLGSASSRGIPMKRSYGAICAWVVAAQLGLGGLMLPADRAAHAATTAPDLMQIYATLSHKRFVDLTHAFGTDTPHWKGFPNMTVRSLYTIAKDGFRSDEYCHVGQWGTHVDAPAHFHAGLQTVEQIDPHDLLLPLVVL